MSGFVNSHETTQLVLKSNRNNYYLTVTLQVTDLPCAFAVIMQVPAFLAVTRPFETEAIVELLDDQVIVVVGMAVATSVYPPPLLRVITLAFSFKVVSLTVTEHDFDIPFAIAVMLHVPGLFPVIVPPETDATDELLLYHEIVELGVAVAVTEALLPTYTVTFCGEIVNVFALTVTVAVVETPLAVAVIVHVPATFPVTRPLLTVATFLSEEFQVTFELGRAVALNV